MENSTVTPPPPLRNRRKIEGISAVLLPFLDDQGTVDWAGFESSVERTVAAGLAPAINMDTGFGNLIDDSVRLKTLEITAAVSGDRLFAAGAFVGDQPGSEFDQQGYGTAIQQITAAGGVPIIFQSYGLTSQSDPDIVKSYAWLGQQCDQFIGFELGQMFAPFGKIYSLDVVEGIMQIENCRGVKHSSLQRDLEWQRLILRDRVRPEFKIYTGNDLAIDMVMYGSDYLLGLSAFAVDHFRKRDDMWENGDADFYQLNDVLQYLGAFSFRQPVPAYKHSAAMFLKLQGLIATDFTHPNSATRPESDREILQHIWQTLSDTG